MQDSLKGLSFVLSKPMKKNKKPTSTNKPEAEKQIKDPSQYVPQRDKIDFNLSIRELNWTEKQKAFIELATEKNTKIIFLSGPSGCSKTVLAVRSALQLMHLKKASEIIYVRSVVESASLSLGSLPGEAQDKFRPFAMPLLDKLEEMLPAGDIKKLLATERIKPIPVNYLRGASYNANVVIVDEAQNFTLSELITVVTRIGKFSKFIILGDPMQTDLKNKESSGFKPLFDVFNDQESQDKGIYCVQFGQEDIMRSEILKFVVDRIEKYQTSKKH